MSGTKILLKFLDFGTHRDIRGMQNTVKRFSTLTVDIQSHIQKTQRANMDFFQKDHKNLKHLTAPLVIITVDCRLQVVLCLENLFQGTTDLYASRVRIRG